MTNLSATRFLVVFLFCAVGLSALTGCGRLGDVGQAPEFTETVNGNEVFAMNTTPFPEASPAATRSPGASLWAAGRQSLLGDRRAGQRGDILTVVIEIDDSAEFSNSSDRGRTGSEEMQLPNFLGLPQAIDQRLPEGATMADAVSGSASSRFNGNGAVRRNEELTLRIAATVVDVLQNGVLRIEGTQEVRVNFELRELQIAGFVRPEDISRQNEITYDKIAGARISYGGRGQISDVQQPRYGQQIADIILPF